MTLSLKKLLLSGTGLLLFSNSGFTAERLNVLFIAIDDLLPIDATIEGDIQLYPTTVEDQKEDFSYKHSNKVLKKQPCRKAGKWIGLKDSLTWTFATDSPRKYQLSCTYSSDSASGQIQATLDKDTFLGTLENTEGPNSWRKLDLGEVELPAGTHTPTLKGTELIGEELLRLRSQRLCF